MRKLIIEDGFINEKLITCDKDIIEQYKHIPIFNNLFVTNIGFFPNAKFHYVERKNGVKEFIIILCKKGKGVVKFNNKNFLLSEKDLIIIPSNTPHIYYSSNNDPWDILWVHFKGLHTSYYFKKYKFNKKIQCGIYDFRLLNILFSEVLDSLENGFSESNLIYSSQVLSNILGLIIFKNTEYITRDTNCNNQRYLYESVLFMKNNLYKSLSLDEIANTIGLSRSHTSSVFKEETGYSPIDFFTHLKIEAASTMLKYSTITIKEISSKFGYYDQYHFSKVFKKIIGLSPKQYRDKYSISND